MTDPPEDVAALEAEFPAWAFRVAWITSGSGPDVRTLLAFPPGAGKVESSVTADGLRRKIREAQR